MGSFSFYHLVKGSHMIILLHCAGIIRGRAPWLSKCAAIFHHTMVSGSFSIATHSLRACLFEVRTFCL